MNPTDLSCQEVAASSKPVAKLIDHLNNGFQIKRKELLNTGLELSSTVKDFELESSFASGRHPASASSASSASWSSEFLADECSFSKKQEKHFDSITNAHFRTWINEFSFEKEKNPEALWAAEFDQAESAMENRLPINEQQQLNELFDQFESLWNGSNSKSSQSESWRDEFSNNDSVTDQTASDFQMFESLWNSKVSNLISSSSKYAFEENNPFMQESDPLSIGLEIFSNPAGSLTEAALAFEAAIQSYLPSSDDIKLLSKAWFLLGNCQAENEKEGAALIAYEESLSIDPKNADALLALAVSLTNEAYDERVIQVLTKWLAIAVDGFIVPTTASRDALISALLEVINRRGWDQKFSSNLQMALGLLFYSMGEFDRSIDCFQTSVNMFPSDYLLWNRLGATLANNHQSEKAIAMYEKALSLKPSFIRALHNLGVSCMNVGCYQEAAEYLIRALKAQYLHPGMPPPAKNISTNLWETLRRTFIFGDRIDMAALCESRSLDQILAEIEETPHWFSHASVNLEP
ncbi:Peroxisomal membrane signal receptor PTS1 [Mitosporidium daphniae]|uniref:Peroxin-5 n=1 Tax=Mitosporidium daphniae TaxID=1485682 RepID=A0A098VUR8_9MICR|nr:uncharacterized protein DI09_42p250 [Mitosporidium daphniae]XP_013239131.1 uncharacterized protein DI09_142p80 [Mitosporidium daphniae]KGG51182.1 hypothetical protein DI09_42p250 [Mitosporidium daphniae]KGG52695.1 hypothetical protein DI09_142p80 [Mitosporidium daphniae]|eukprot:XP_013237609.1 uncharacterized protein DI09_42p250 [Mitosporidium daphniae]